MTLCLCWILIEIELECQVTLWTQTSLGSTVSSVQTYVSLLHTRLCVLYSFKRTLKMHPSCASVYLDHYGGRQSFVITGRLWWPEMNFRTHLWIRRSSYKHSYISRELLATCFPFLFFPEVPTVSHRSIHTVLNKCVLRVEIKSNSYNWENALEYHRQVILADRCMI